REPSLLRMRRAMLGVPSFAEEAMARTGLRPARAMVAIGGMEGIRDEANVLLGESPWPTPIYAFTSGGAAARRLPLELPSVRAVLAQLRYGTPAWLAATLRLPPFA